MFKNETVFILGAGASRHYGYPTGEELVKKVITKADYLKRFLSFNPPNNNYYYSLPNIIAKDYIPDFILAGFNPSDPLWKLPQIGTNIVSAAFQEAFKQCDNLKTRLEVVNPPVIDYFLHDNPDVQEIGKLLIAMVLIECETKMASLVARRNYANINDGSPNSKNDWLRFIIHQLLVKSKEEKDIVTEDNKVHHLLENKVSFITFNYDTSLEDKLYSALSHIDVIDNNIRDEFFSEKKDKKRFFHIYGKINSKIGLSNRETQDLEYWSADLPVFGDEYLNNKNKLRELKSILDRSYAAAQTLKTIAGSNGNKPDNSEEIVAAKEKIKNAKVVYILGYGFDEENSDKLGLKEALNPKHGKYVMFTNFENKERINKKAGIAFCNDPNFFSGDKNIQQRLNQSGKPSYYYERSIKNVYDAFADDFDALETYDL